MTQQLMPEIVSYFETVSHIFLIERASFVLDSLISNLTHSIAVLESLNLNLNLTTIIAFQHTHTHTHTHSHTNTHSHNTGTHAFF